MTDEHGETDLTPEEQADVAAALAKLGYLAAPESPHASVEASAPMPPVMPPVMPPDVWDRMVDALNAPPALATVTPLRPRRRLLPGLAAAAVAVIAIGVGVSVMRPAASDVADAPAAVAPADEVPSSAAKVGVDADPAAAPAADPAAASDETVQVPPPSDGPMVGAAAPQTRAMIMPTRYLMSSGTEYTTGALDQQVDGLLQKVGAASPVLASAVPTPTSMTPVGMGGFTSDLVALRECITGVMHSTASAALVVDRATFDGGDAGIIIVPQADRVDVWIVGPDCTRQAPAVLHHMMHAWSASKS